MSTLNLHMNNTCDWILENQPMQIVTLSLFHFIGSGNSYTHIPPIHSATTITDWSDFLEQAFLTM